MGTDQKKDALKAQFREIDKNGDNKLDFREFTEMLEPFGLDRTSAKVLFRQVDLSGDGVIDFDEFVDFIYSRTYRDLRRSSASSARHSRLSSRASAISTQSENEELWAACRKVFQTYQGSDERFEGKDFRKICIDCTLFDRRFTKNDVDLVFAKYKPRGQHVIEFPEFQNCLREVAKKKGIATAVVQAAIAGRENLGVKQSHVTHSDYVRFHDDKRTYTGMHGANENHGVAQGEGEIDPRVLEMLRAAHVKPAEVEELDWGPVEKAFYSFCQGDMYLSCKEWLVMCADARLYVLGKFESSDATAVFNKVKVPGERRVDWEQFRALCIATALKRERPVSEVQSRIMEATGGLGPSGREGTP